MKKLLFTFIMLIPIVAWAQTSGTTGDCTWKYDSSSKMLRISGSGAMGNYTLTNLDANYPWADIASEVQTIMIDEGVTSIGACAFYEFNKLILVSIPNSVKSIGEDCFRDCDALESISIPDGVERIGLGVFYDCGNLRYAKLPNSIEFIPPYLFYKCYKLSDITIPSTVKSISSYSFEYCYFLTEITIPENCKNINSMAFFRSGLEKITLPKAIASIGFEAFKDCKSLTKITSLSESPCEPEEAAFDGLPETCTLYIPSNVDKSAYTSKGWTEELFKGGIINLALRNGVIGDCTFDFDSSTKTLTISGNGPMPDYESQEDQPWRQYASEIECVIIGDGVTHIGGSSFATLTNLSELHIGDRVKSIGYEAFKDCESLTEVELPDGITELKVGVFSDCYALKSIHLPEGLQKIPDYAFYNCQSLESISIPSTVTIISYCAFWNCKSIDTIILPASVKLISDLAFSDCSYLSQVVSLGDGSCIIRSGSFSKISPSCTLTIPFGTTDAYISNGWTEDVFAGGITELPPTSGDIGECSWSYDVVNQLLTISGSGSTGDFEFSFDVPWTFLASGIESVIVEPGVTEIGNYVLSSLSNLKHVSLPEGLTRIGEHSFDYDSSLEELYIPSTVTEIGAGAFYYCSKLGILVLPPGITKIEPETFSYCYNLSEVSIPYGITEIGESAFLFCENLGVVSIPNSVTSIGSNAFSNCSSLDCVISYLDTPFEFGDWAFYDIDGSCELIVMPGMVDSHVAKGWTDDVFGGGISEYDLSGKIGDCTWRIDYTKGELIISGTGSMEMEEAPWYAFRDYIKKATIEEGVKNIEGINNLPFLSEVSIASTVESIGSLAIAMCPNLKSLTLPDGLTTIGKGAFSYSGLTSLTIPNSVTSIGYGFAMATSIKSVTLPDGLTEIPYAAFEDCHELKKIHLPSSVTSIEDEAFAFSGLESEVWIGESVSHIGAEAFLGCKKLKEVYSYPFIVDIGINAFMGLHEDCFIRVPRGMTASYLEHGLVEADFGGGIRESIGGPIEVTIGDAGMATFSYYYDLDFTDSDLEAYIVSAFIPDKGVAILTKVNDVKAGTGVVLIGEPGTYELESTQSTTIVSNMLVGNLVKRSLSKEEGEYTNYILADGKFGVGFYAAADNSVLAAKKAYLPLLTSSLALLPESDVKMVNIVFDDGLNTDIDTLDIAGRDNGVYYNLSGQRVNNPTTGIYIKNGKKVFIK